MKKISVGNLIALVDDEDFDLVSRFHWVKKRVPNSDIIYARNVKRMGKFTKEIRMHRLILNPKPDEEIDHIDRNGLNNQKYNLRLSLDGENQINRISKTGSSRFKGVYFNKDVNKWAAQIQSKGKNHWLGCYDDEFEAAMVYDVAARKLFGEVARCNL